MSEDTSFSIRHLTIDVSGLGEGIPTAKQKERLEEAVKEILGGGFLKVSIDERTNTNTIYVADWLDHTRASLLATGIDLKTINLVTKSLLCPRESHDTPKEPIAPMSEATVLVRLAYTREDSAVVTKMERLGIYRLKNLKAARFTRETLLAQPGFGKITLVRLQEMLRKAGYGLSGPIMPSTRVHELCVSEEEIAAANTLARHGYGFLGNLMIANPEKLQMAATYRELQYIMAALARYGYRLRGFK